MSYKGWRYAGTIILVGLFILVTALLLYFVGDSTTLSIFTESLAPSTAFILGIAGLSEYGRESLVKDDRFHALNVWMAMGLIIFSLSEVAGIILHLIGSVEIIFVIGLVQLPALMLWGLGVLGYLRASNSALGVSKEGLWTRVVLIAVFVGLILVVFEVLFISRINYIQMIISLPMVVGVGLILAASGRLLWILRSGLIARPLTLMFLGILLYFIRVLFWNFITYAPGLPFDYMTAIESYILIGASLFAASSLEAVYDIVEEIEE